jgi:hypothetical protein
VTNAPAILKIIKSNEAIDYLDDGTQKLIGVGTKLWEKLK